MAIGLRRGEALGLTVGRCGPGQWTGRSYEGALACPDETWPAGRENRIVCRLRAVAGGAGCDLCGAIWPDDHSRYLLTCTAYRRVTGPDVVASFTDTAATYGLPAPP